MSDSLDQDADGTATHADGVGDPVDEPAIDSDLSDPVRRGGVESKPLSESCRGSNSCSREHCYAPDAACVDGNSHYQDCDDWSGGAGARTAEPSGQRPTWSGHALGAVDLEVVTALRRPRLVAIAGAAGAGKTSALATYFLAIRKGHQPGGLAFSGSFTLIGWHSVARHLSFPPAGSRGFPPHTTSSGGRSPALLHLRLANPSGGHADLLLTDVPGEWFEEWAFDSSAASGAQWIAERADVFAVMSDSVALSGADRGVACSNYGALADRVSSVAAGRQAIPIRAKADVEVPDGIRSRLQGIDQRAFGMEAHPLSVVVAGQSQPVIGVLDDLVVAAVVPRLAKRQPRPAYGDPFLDMSSSEMTSQ